MENTINKDTIIKISVEDITKIVNAFNDQNIPVEAIIEEIEISQYTMDIESEIRDIKEFRKKNSRITTSTSHTYDFSDDIFDLIREIKRSFKKNTIDIRIFNNNVLISINNG